MKKKRLIAVICAAAVAVLSAAYAGCDKSKTLENQQDDAVNELYQDYVEIEATNGNEKPLSYEEWLASIKGDKGEQGIQGEKGEDGEDGAPGAKGEKGDKGDDGSDGKSAYQIWLDAGNEGTEADFINFLKGVKGDKGDTGDKGDKGDKGDRGEQGEKGDKGDKGDSGTNGTNGLNGVSVIGASIDESTHLIIKLSDGTEIDAGYVGVPVSGEKQKYKVTFIADGVKVAEVEYTEGDKTVTEPQVPHKEGYTGSWNEYTLNNENITVNAKYTPIQQEEPPTPVDPEDPVQPVNPDDFKSEDEYVINVTSAGGLKLNGVKISIVHESGTVLASDISRDGRVAFGLILGEYTVQADPTTLPEGYYLSDAVFKTSATERLEVGYKIPSKVSNGTLADDYKYKIGDIARDFTVTDVNQNSYSLSQLSQSSSAVFLFFFDPNSGDIRNQLNMLENALEYARSKNKTVKILAICATGSEGDLKYCVQENQDITIPMTSPMTKDGTNLVNHFNFIQIPTTVIIDRYGLIAKISPNLMTGSGELFTLIDEYASADYVQNIS